MTPKEFHSYMLNQIKTAPLPSALYIAQQIGSFIEKSGYKNPFEDLIVLHNDIQEINKRKKEIDSRADIVENGKRVLQNHINEIIYKNLPISDLVADSYNLKTTQLHKIVEERKKLFPEFKKLSEQREQLDRKSEEGFASFDNLVTDNSISELFLEQIEQLIAKYKEIVEQQKKNITKRMEILAKEELLIAESKVLFNIK